MNYLSHLTWWIWLQLHFSFYFTHTRKSRSTCTLQHHHQTLTGLQHSTLNIAEKNPWQVSWHQHPCVISSTTASVLRESQSLAYTHLQRVLFEHGFHYCTMGFFLIVLIFVSLTLYLCALTPFSWISWIQSVNCVKLGGWWLLIVCTCFSVI